MFIDEHNVCNDEFKITTYNVDSAYRALPEFYFDVVQEISGVHSYEGHVAVPHLNAEGKSWVITRTIMDIYSYPKWPEVLKVRTGIPFAKSYYAPRAVVASDSSGNPVFSAKSMWAVIDIQSRMPLKMAEISEKIGPVTYTDGPFIDCGKRSPKLDTDAMVQKPLFSEYKPDHKFYDTDINGHTNNIVYLKWMLEAMPFDYMKKHNPSYIDINWLHEVHVSDSVEVKVYELEENSFGYIASNLTKNEISSVGQINFKSFEEFSK
ncbi:MAG: hypothetical protein K6F82_01180 [Sphaerochaetaceae bacterium]|nr:hypothetical protein [Sphaerochaetaceae bacterium]